jgi:hypothetical protein
MHITTTITGHGRADFAQIGRDGLAAAGKRMYDAECALHLARQAGVDEWVATAYQVLHTAIAEHSRWLALTGTHPVAGGHPARFGAARRPAEELPTLSGTDVYELADLRLAFPAVPYHILSAVFEAYLAVRNTPAEAFQATRERLADALKLAA